MDREKSAMSNEELEAIADPVVTIPHEHWAKFEAWVRAPAKENPALRALLARHPAWQD